MYCTSCGAEIRGGSKFCTKCGAPQNVGSQVATVSSATDPVVPSPPAQPALPPEAPMAPPAQDRNPQKSGGRTGLIVAVIILALLVCVLGIALFFRGRNNAATTQPQDTYADAGEAGDPAQTQDGLTDALKNSYDQIVEKISSLTRMRTSFISSDVSDYPNVRLYFRMEDDSENAVIMTSPTAGIKERVASGEWIEREIRRIERLEGNEGLSIELLADKSYSMITGMDQMKSIMTDFVNSLDYDSGDRVELISFDTFLMYMCTYTDDASLLENGIYNMTPYGDTALYDALYEGVQNAAAQTGARCVIAFTDGMDNRSVHTADEVIRYAIDMSVPVYIIGVGSVDTTVLTRICDSTQGHYWYINELLSMNEVLSEIYKEQKDMYCVEYISDSSIDAYADRSFQLAIGDDNYGCEVEESFTPVRTIEHTAHSSRYEIVQADVSWSEANRAAISKGGHLATITSENEMNTLTTMAENAGLTYLWIGGYTSVRSSSVYGHWVTGEDFYYSSWYPGEPSRNDLDGAPEMYLMLWYVNDYWSWNDQRDDPIRETGLTYFLGKTGYIIEYEY